MSGFKFASLADPRTSELVAQSDYRFSNFFSAQNRGLCVIYGPWESFKSTIARALVGSFLNDEAFLGAEADGFGVGENALYLALEDPQKTLEYFRAGGTAKGWTEMPLVYHEQQQSTTPLNLRDRECREAFARHVDEKFSLVVIDTAQKAGGAGCNPNDPSHVTDLLAGAEHLRELLQARWVIAITHAGQDISNGIRGSSAWYDAPALVLRVERKAKSLRGSVYVEKDRFFGRHGHAATFGVEFLPVEVRETYTSNVDHDANGKMVRATRPTIKEHRYSVTFPNFTALEADGAADAKPLSAAVRHKAKLHEILATESPDGSPVPREVLFAKFREYALSAGVRGKHARSRFHEAEEALVAEGVVKVEGDQVAAAAT